MFVLWDKEVNSWKTLRVNTHSERKFGIRDRLGDKCLNLIIFFYPVPDISEEGKNQTGILVNRVLS